MAEDFHVKVAAINGSPKIDYERIALPGNSRAVVSADKNGVRYNFASKAAIDAILGESEDMLTVADEARTKLSTVAGAKAEIHALIEMEREVRKCFDIQYGVRHPSFGAILGLAKP